MFVPFESISPDSRIWIYQSTGKFSRQDSDTIHAHLRQFTESWLVHGKPLRCSYDIRYDQFIILAVDESYSAPSGCSIDSSVNAIKALEPLTGHRFFERNLVAFMDRGEVILIPVQQLKQKFRENIWNEATFAFNNLVDKKWQLERNWLVPAGKTWLNRYAVRESVAN